MDLASSAIAAEGCIPHITKIKIQSGVVAGEGEGNLERIEDVPNEWAQMAQRVEIYTRQSAVDLEQIGRLVSLFKLLNGCFVHHLALHFYLTINPYVGN